jgi:hypothetical protein
MIDRPASEVVAAGGRFLWIGRRLNRSRWLRGHRQKEREMNRKKLYLIGIVLLLVFVAFRIF